MGYVMTVRHRDSEKNKPVIIDDGSILFCRNDLNGSNMMSLNTSGFLVEPGNVTFLENVQISFKQEEGISYAKRLLLEGFSSFIQMLHIKYEKETERIFRQSRQQLDGSPIDYIHAARVPLERLTPSWIRKLKQLSVPVISFYVRSEFSLKKIPWQRLIDAAFPLRIMFIFDDHASDLPEKARDHMKQEWESIVKELRINSYFHLPRPGCIVPLLFLKRAGLYPAKGTFDSGSDADYFMYLNNRCERLGQHLPDIVVLKGQVVKYGNSWDLSHVRGEERLSVIPEQFLPIHAINQYTAE